MNIYVISLIERKDRMKLFLQQSTEQNIDYKLIEAIDGRELDEDLWIVHGTHQKTFPSFGIQSSS